MDGIRRNALSLALFLFSTSGCAFTRMTLPLPTEGLNETVPGGAGRQVIVTVPFDDAREITQLHRESGFEAARLRADHGLDEDPTGSGPSRRTASAVSML